MATVFSSLPVVDLAPLSTSPVFEDDLARLSRELDNVFCTTGFAYLVNPPLSLGHDDIFGLAGEFFALPDDEKMKLAKKSFRPSNKNTYRGYFPPQPGQTDNLKEGFEIGPSQTQAPDNHHHAAESPINLTEPNVWPSSTSYPPSSRAKLQHLHQQLQTLSMNLLSLLARALNRPHDAFTPWLTNSISTLRLLHYPIPSPPPPPSSPPQQQLCCTPHTDSGLLTLLHQDATGGLQVRNAAGAWVDAPYLAGSVVVNVGDLLAHVSGGRYVATLHRVQSSGGSGSGGGTATMGRLSVPFFFEPGEKCIIRTNDEEEGVRYGDHVRAKMKTWVEFQGV